MESTTHLVIGPPGTGKTTHLVDVAFRAARKFGATKVAIVSMTRAAAAEVRKRKVPIPKQQVRTLHSYAWQAVGAKKSNLAFNSANAKAWREKVGDREGWAVYGSHVGEDSVGSSEGLSNKRGENLLIEDLSACRARLIPHDEMKGDIREFAEAWTEWKEDNEFFDFDDLIELAHFNDTSMPGDPRVIYADEAQDLSALEMMLLKRWGEKCGSLVLVGDPDQTIYAWRGANPELFQDVPETNRRVLGRSYRVPRAVHCAAMDVIEKLPDRLDVTYLPRDHEGSVEFVGLTYRAGSSGIVDQIEVDVRNGRTVYALATTARILNPVKMELKARGVPFWNPMATQNAGWNPLGGYGDRMRRFLKAVGSESNPDPKPWTNRDVWRWAEHIDAKTYLARGTKSYLKSLNDSEMLRDRLAINEGENPEAFFLSLFRTEKIPEIESAIGHLGGLCPAVLTHVIKASFAQKFAYACRVFSSYGYEGLFSDPKVVIGTIHSVKGGEADTVYVSPSLSAAGFSSFCDRKNGGFEETVRLFYVAYTRARDTLKICSPDNPMMQFE